jgi:hypothetical protein
MYYFLSKQYYFDPFKKTNWVNLGQRLMWLPSCPEIWTLSQVEF